MTFPSWQGNYTGSQPCLAALLQRAVSINSSVLLLPEGLAGKVALLRDAQVRRGVLAVWECTCGTRGVRQWHWTTGAWQAHCT